MTSRLFICAVVGASFFVPVSGWACSSCGCILNSDWASQGYSVDGGVRFDARYDYFNQGQLRAGSRSFDRNGFSLPTAREIQQSTINRNLTFGLDYSPNRDWGVNVQVPVFDRPHTTVAPGDDEISRSRSRGIGDVRVIARYQGFSGDRSLGVQFGLKLPTGRTNFNFTDGPQAGSPLDRGLQPGTGTADVLLGAYHFGAFTEQLGYFANTIVQLPVNAKDGFKPGAGLNINLGFRYLTDSGITPQLQLNTRLEKRESGSNADAENSGATLVNLSPGVTLPISKNVNVYGYIQVPIYQRVNGLQLEPHYTVSIGLRYRYH